MQVLTERMRQLEIQLVEVNESLKEYVSRLSKVEQMNVAQSKDTDYIYKSMSDLQLSIERLIEEISCIKEKPLEKYERIAMIVISGLIGSIITLAINGVI